ncbi:MAG: hypothetical protein IPM56_13175 [Ignavibacteriales bacterium]|nr:MAG: hypothetical protein IPM56_13175 [Ignavibacteriales bacterium]
MKNFTITESAIYTKKISGHLLVNDYLRIPLRYGFSGLAIMFSLCSLMKYFGFLAGARAEFSVGTDEVMLSLIGFVILFLIRFLANYRNSITEKVQERKIYTSEAA